jgi:5-methylthioadenosine/S-adenosylhomocysteine deaminase
MPGFINTHIHIFQSLLKGLGADHRLVEWLNLSALPYGTKTTPEQQFLAAQLASMEAIRSGCTTLAEFFYTNQDVALADAVIQGMLSTGIRSVFIRTFQDCGAEYGMPAEFIEDAALAISRVAELRGRYAGSEYQMLDIWTGPDVTWSTTREGYATMLEYCLAEGVNYSMHILETEVDNQMCQRLYGQDIVDMLEQLGFLTQQMMGVHCVNLTPEDIRRFAHYGVSISHNPAPNLYLGSGVAPIPAAAAAGVNISLGTDGAASNNTTNMLETMKLAAVVQKGIHRDAAIITAPEICAFATRGGAAALHKQDMIGSLEVGKQADLIVFDPDELTSTPMHDPLATVVYASEPRNIKTVVINGKIVLQDGIFVNGINEAQLITDFKAAVTQLLKS